MSSELIELKTIHEQFLTDLSALESYVKGGSESLGAIINDIERRYEYMVHVGEKVFENQSFEGFQSIMSAERERLGESIRQLRDVLKIDIKNADDVQKSTILDEISRSSSILNSHAEKFVSFYSSEKSKVEGYLKNRESYEDLHNHLMRSKNNLEEKITNLNKKSEETVHHAESLFYLKENSKKGVEKVNAEIKKTVIDAYPENTSDKLKVTIGVGMMGAMVSYMGYFSDKVSDYSIILAGITFFIGIILLGWGLYGMIQSDKERNEHYRTLFIEYLQAKSDEIGK